MQCMQHILNTSDIDYTNACRWPVVQQIYGGFTVLRHAIGLIKDIAIMILFCKGPEELNNHIRSTMGEMLTLKENLELVNKTISQAEDLVWIATLNGTQTEEFIKSSQENFNEIRRTLNLKPLDPQWEQFCDKGEAGTWSGLNSDALRLKFQLQDKEAEYNTVYLMAWLCEVEPPLERLHNIYIGVMSAIPVVGTLYNIASVYYIENVMNQQEVHA